MVATVPRLLLGPSFNKRVTAPSASVQVISKGVPSVISQLELVKATRAKALEMAAEKATRRAVNCILANMFYDLIIRVVLLSEKFEWVSIEDYWRCLLVGLSDEEHQKVLKTAFPTKRDFVEISK